jgi:hypothetical protein
MDTLGLEKQARAFFDALADVYAEYRHDIGEETFRYWQDAVSLSGEPGS